jgi:membrane protein DedA with SNARE-associated domain
VPWFRTALVIVVASSVWYGLIIWFSFKVGADWEQVRTTLHIVGRRALVTALVAATLLAFVGWRLWKRHHARHLAAK